MLQYIRNPNCECKDFIDINTIPFDQRKDVNKFFKNGICYNKDTCFECNCHKMYRGISKYELLAKQKDLPGYEQLKSLKYEGDNTSFLKLKNLISNIYKYPEYLDTIFYIYGKEGCQKTTSILKIIVDILKEDKTVEYEDFNNLIKQMLDLKYTDNSLKDVDLLIVDDCFIGDTVNFKSTYNNFFNLCIKRKKPTILITNKSLDKLSESTLYNKEILDIMIDKIRNRNTSLEFKDNIHNIQLKNKGTIDLWSLE